MKKKLFTMVVLVLVVAVCAVALVGCGNKVPTKDNTKFIIGATGPLTDEAAIYGEAVKNAAELAVDEINAAGGLNGVEFKLDFRDDRAKPSSATALYSSLYDAGMNVSMGSVTTGACTAFSKEAVKDDLFFITPSASGVNAIKDNDNAYRICFSDPDQGRKAAERFKSDEFKNEFGDMKIGVIYLNDDDYSKGIYNAFMDNKGDLEVVSTNFSSSDKDFNSGITKLKDANCDIMLLLMYYGTANLICQAAQEQNYEPQIFGSDGLDGLEYYAKVDVSGVEYFSSFDANSEDEKVVNFVTDYKAKYNKLPNQFAADAYDAVYIIYNLMKKADIKDPTISMGELSAKIQPFMADFSFSGVTGENMTWDKDGNCVKEIKIIEIA